MNLYDINASLLMALANSADEDGEINEENWEKIQALQLTLDEKVESIALYIETLEDEAQAIENKIASLKERAKAKKNRADSIKSYLTGFMINNNLDKFESDSVKIKFNKSKRVVITDELLLTAFAINHPDIALIRVKTTQEFDKVSIGNALKQGIEVTGATLEENKTISIK